MIQYLCDLCGEIAPNRRTPKMGMPPNTGVTNNDITVNYITFRTSNNETADLCRKCLNETINMGTVTKEPLS